LKSTLEDQQRNLKDQADDEVGRAVGLSPAVVVGGSGASVGAKRAGEQERALS